jgi:hypothetical protein
MMRISRQPFTIPIMTAQKQLENVAYFHYSGNMITNDAGCTWEIKFKTAMAKAAFNKKIIFTTKLDLNLSKKLVRCYIWSTLRETDEKYLGHFEMWCSKRMEKMSWTNHVRNEKVLHTARKRGISYIQHAECGLTRLVTSCIGTAISNTLLKERYREEVMDRSVRTSSSYRMTLRKREDTLN